MMRWFHTDIRKGNLGRALSHLISREPNHSDVGARQQLPTLQNRHAHKETRATSIPSGKRLPHPSHVRLQEGAAGELGATKKLYDTATNCPRRLSNQYSKKKPRLKTIYFDSVSYSKKFFKNFSNPPIIAGFLQKP